MHMVYMYMKVHVLSYILSLFKMYIFGRLGHRERDMRDREMFCSLFQSPNILTVRSCPGQNEEPSTNDSGFHMSNRDAGTWSIIAAFQDHQQETASEA